MTGNRTSPEDRFAALVDAFAGEPGVTHASDATGRRRRGFGNNALMVNDKIFAMLVGGTLVVKIPRTRVDGLVEAGEGERFEPQKNGRVMREWLVLDPGSGLEWTELAEEARRFVGGA